MHTVLVAKLLLINHVKQICDIKVQRGGQILCAHKSYFLTLSHNCRYIWISIYTQHWVWGIIMQSDVLNLSYYATL